ncbi:YihY/virulence factor BrkB family protein [Oceanobacillus damuensis]|uniref:YihY/virulence factor BrkB family protein n=1 Tax=Oceanobacillus damuensis TaxID=937928 RepID=UPI000833C873|nr:YihY/virulence factor BrkB family protein [Oceanobacillus damuensis]
MKNIGSLVRQFYQRIEEVDVFGLAAQLAYFFLLSLFPFLIFLLNLIAYLPINEQLILQTIDTFAPREVMDLINANVSQILNEQNGSLLSFSIIGTLWAASNGVNAITRAFNRAYRIEKKRSFFKDRLIAILLTIAMIAVILVALLLPVFGREIGEYIFSIFGLSAGFLAVWETLRWVISSVIFFIVLLFLYKLAPHKRIYFKNVIWGTLFATVSWQIVSWGFSFYVGNFGDYSSTYGSLGTIIVLMIWFYLFGIIIITGGVINAFIRKYREQKPEAP